MTRRILAVTHEASLTGAPTNLLHLLRWMRSADDVEVHTLILRDGELRPAFEAIGPVTVLDRRAMPAALAAYRYTPRERGHHWSRYPFAAALLSAQVRGLRDFDLVYLNSLPSIGVLPYLPRPRRVVAHVHELEVAFRTHPSARDLAAFRTAPDLWIAASGAVRDLLVGEVGIDEGAVRVHHEFIDARAVAGRDVRLREVEQRRREWRLPVDAPIVLGVGTLEWRKGADLFVQLAAEVGRGAPEAVHFAWVGGQFDGVDWQRVRSDLERTVANVQFVGIQTDPVPWYDLADVFALTSREDPFPLVCLEAAARARPIVTFRNGGTPELLEAAGPEAALGVCDHLDTPAMARRVTTLLADHALRREAGLQLQRRVLAAHDVTVAAPALWADVVALLDER